MTVSEKRMASAYEILIAAGAEYFNTYYDEGEPGELYENGLVASIAPHVAAALAAAEREGMRRAEAICYARSKDHHKQSKKYEADGDELSQTQCLADAVEAMNCAAYIRAQEGEA